MTPLYFGPSEAPLYGVYHPPLGADRHAGVVLCYPFGQEYMRAHRAYRQLAMMLTRQGYHVLRFDFRGTGDSFGGLTGVRFADWMVDIGHAIDELRDSTGIRTVSLLGLRLGALAAAQVCHARKDIERLMLWDPVLSGPAYEEELLAQIAQRAAAPGADPEAQTGTALAADGTLYFNGFALPQAFRDSWRDLAALEQRPAGVRRILLAVSHETAAFAALQQRLAGEGFDYRHAPAPHDWNFVDNFGSILLPQPVLQAVVDWME
ncbi:MAG TPA: alpha/beta hydrolase [Spongiibacteraceae bacterium]|nr:alpha/beta hydrolase [Spongiibacteraceae bacterium]